MNASRLRMLVTATTKTMPTNRMKPLAPMKTRTKSFPLRPLTGALILSGAIAGSLGILEPAKALVYIPGQGYASSLVTVIQCGAIGPYAVPPCPNISTKRRARKIYVVQDPPGSGLTSFSTSFTYDPSVMRFDANETSLLCELRSASASPFCPVIPAGVGKQSLGTIEDFEIDQTGLSINEDLHKSSVSIAFTSSNPITFTGERNFLALAFDWLLPLEPGASVTYSPSPMSDATLSITNFSCDVDCTSSHPAVALRLDPVPGPLAAGGLPVMAHASHRLRQRIRRAAIR